MFGKSANDGIRAEKHDASVNSKELNRSTERAVNEEEFVDAAIRLLEGINFPVYRQQIIDHVKAASPESDYIRLFETLDNYIRYDDIEQIQAAFEVNLPYGKHRAAPWRREGIKSKTTPAT